MENCNITDLIKSILKILIIVCLGKGEDCHRTWEAILFGAIPIVRNSTGLWPLFKQNPIYVTNEWENVDENQYLNFKPKTTSRKMVLAQYWFDRINQFRNK